MAKKRKRDPRVDSNSPDAKLLEASCMPSDWMPVAQQFLDVLGSIRDELRGIAQAKSTLDVLADKFLKLDEKVENILNKSKEELKEEIKEVVKLEMQGNFGKSDGVQLDNNQNQFKVICDDYSKAPDCSDASPSLRSQPHQSQPQRFRLQINSTMNSVSYKGRSVQTNDGRDVIEVQMRDGDNLIAADHPLASAKVNLVLVDSDLFHGISKKLWSADEFRETLWNRENAKLLKNGSFTLNGGRATQSKVTIMQGTVRKEVRLGVMLEDLGSERVLEGLSNPFKVQEAKTANREKHKESATNGTGRMCNPLGQSPCSNDQHYLPRQILSPPMQHDSREREGSAAHHTTQGLPRHIGESFQQTICKMEDPHQGRLPHFYDARSSHPQAMIQGSSHLASSQTEGNGHGRISGPQCNQQAMMTQRCAVPNRSQIMQRVAGNDPISRPQQQYTNPLATTQQYHHDLDINMPYSSTYKTNDPQTDPEHLRHTQTGGNGQRHVVSSRQQILPPSSLLPINSQSVEHGDNYQQGQRKILPQDTSTDTVKHGQGQFNSSQYHNLTQTVTLAKPSLTMGLGQLNSHQDHSLQEKNLFPATHAQSMGQANFFEEKFDHGQPQILLETGKEEVMGGKGQGFSSMHNTLTPSSLLDINSQSVGHEDNFQEGQRKILPQDSCTEAVNYGQQQLNSSQYHNLTQTITSAKPSQTKYLLYSSQNMPHPSTSQVNAPQRDFSWQLPLTLIGGNGEGQFVSSTHNTLPPCSLLDINAQSVGQEDNFQQTQRQILPQHTSIESVKQGQGQLNYSQYHNLSESITSTKPAETMGEGQFVSSTHNTLPPCSLLDINAQSVGQEDNFQQSQRQILPQHTSIEAVKQGQGQLNYSQYHNLSQSITSTKAAETMDLLNSSQNMPRPSTSQINAPQRDISWSIPLTQIGGNGQAKNCEEKFEHGQPQIFLETGKEEVMSGKGKSASSTHNTLPPRSLLDINSQSVGQEDNFQPGQRQILFQHTSTEGINHGQGRINSSQYHNHPQTFPLAKATHTMDLLNSSQNMPRPSTSQINALERDISWSSPLTHIGENGQIQILSQPTSTEATKHGLAQLNSHQDHSLQQNVLCPPMSAQPTRQSKNCEDKFEHGQPQISLESGKEEVMSGKGQVSPHPILPQSSLLTINFPSVGQEDNFQQGQTQILIQHTDTEAVKHAGQGQLNSSQQQNVQQNIISAMRPHIMDLDMRLNSSQYMPYSSTSQINTTQRDPGTSRHTQSGGNEQEGNFQQGQRQILPQNTSTEAAKHGQGQLNSQNLLPAMPRQTMDLATRLNSSQNRPHYLDALASEVNPPQSTSHFPINNSSGTSVENSGSSQTPRKDSVINTSEWSDLEADLERLLAGS